VIDRSTYRKAENGVTCHLGTLEDLPAIYDLWECRERILGPQDKPMLFARPVVLTLVAEDESGKIVDAVYFEATIDVTKIGCPTPDLNH
jgi:hypothetical protein